MFKNLSQQLIATRNKTSALAAPLSEADMQIQAASFASPGKWHLAHTTWFFEAFILRAIGLKSSNAEPYQFLFNSYYDSIGERQPQHKRGLISRPSLQEIMDYRHEVEAHVLKAIADGLDESLLKLIKLGIEHEQQHQELFLTDILYQLSQNPIYPAYLQKSNSASDAAVSQAPQQMQAYTGGLMHIGHDSASFCFDNEQPRHAVFIAPYQLATHLVTNAEWITFIEAGGYQNPLFWLADGWNTAQQEEWQMPLYWQEQNGQYFHFTLNGLQPLNLAAPVCHISFFEADAFARWSGKRLPTEAEWEHAAAQETQAIFSTHQQLTPQAAKHNKQGLQQLYGEVWQWTASPYMAYPGFKASTDAVGEYNGKFMNGQYVLRGASFATAENHARISYRNFFYPHQRWQFTGLRLAE